MEDERLIKEMLEVIGLQETLIESLKNKISDLLELNDLLERQNDLTQKLLAIEEKKLPVINYN